MRCSSQLVEKRLAEFRLQGRNEIQSIFCRDMCVAKNTSQPANVQIVFHQKNNACAAAGCKSIALAGTSLSKCSVGVF